MGSVKFWQLLPALLGILFFTLCVHFARKAKEGPWHEVAVQLWEKEDWQKLRALGVNLNDVGKEDVESFYLAMRASEEIQDGESAKFFASRLLETRVLSFRLEKEIARLLKPSSNRMRVALFRTRIVFASASALLILLILSWRRNEPYKLAPTLISAAGIAVLAL